VRGIEPSKTPAPPPPYPAAASRSISGETSQYSPLDDGYILIAAALARQTAKEYAVGDQAFGALTHFLTKELHEAAPEATYQEVMQRVERQIADCVSDQTPQLVGPRRDRYVFGVQQKIAAPYALVMSSGAPPGKVRLPYTGEIHGVTVGSRYDAYAPDTAVGPGVQALAQIEISDVTPFDSMAAIVTGGAIPDYSRAVLREQKLGGRKLRVWMQNAPGSAALEAVREALRPSPDLLLTSDPGLAHVQVIEHDGWIALYSPDGVQLSEPIGAANQGVGLDILEQLVKWARWFYMLGLENRASNLRVRLSITPSGAWRGGQRSSELPQLEKPQVVFHPGDLINVDIHNDSDRPLYVSLLVLSSDRSITVLYPSRGLAGAAVEVKAGGTRPLGFSPRATLPRGLRAARDNFLLIATARPIELFQYEQRGFVRERSRGSDDLRCLLEQGSIGMRGWEADPGEWTTFRTTVEVRAV
jgi:hypothetical protein